jgi:4-amino-4-deoxy-L-arabinose transferase-like glycosyltransferase
VNYLEFKREHIYPILLIVICILIAGIMYKNNSLNTTADDAFYMSYAQQIYHHQFNPLETTYTYGYFMSAQIAISFILFGITTFATAVPFVLEYILLILVIYLTAKKYFEPRIAFSAALITSFTAFLAVYSTRLFPDIPIGLLVACALYLSLEEGKGKLFTAGMLIGMILFFKTGAMLVAPIFIIALLLSKPRKKVLWFTLGLLIMSFIYLTTIGFNIGIINTYSQNQVSLHTIQVTNTVTSLAKNLVQMLYVYPIGYSKITFIQIFPLGALFIFAIIGGIWVIHKKEKKFIFAFFIMLAVYGYLFLGTESLHQYFFIVVVGRYFIWIIPFMALLAAYFLDKTYKIVKERFGDIMAIEYLAFMVFIALLSNLPFLILFATHRYDYMVGAPTTM